MQKKREILIPCSTGILFWERITYLFIEKGKKTADSHWDQW